MKRTKLNLIAALLAFLSLPLAAQNTEDEFEIIFTDDGNQREVIGVPMALYMSELDSLMSLYHNQNYLTLDDDCEARNESPDYTIEEVQERLSRMPCTINMTYNPIVKQFIDRYVMRMRKTVSVMLGTSNFYMPIFEQALESYNVPLELKYLPVIESALNPKAVSRVGATGLWQFMLGTGKQYGLRVNSLVDDRKDPIRSSYAAAHFLRDLYRIFGDWTLAIAAYNCGPENVNKAIRRSGGSRDYWTIYPHLPAETRGYVPAFIAANYVMTYYCEHNICPMLTNLPEHTDTVVVSKNVSFSTLSKFCDIDINLLRELNPQYRRDLVNGLSEPSTIRMPISSINKFVEAQDSIIAYDAQHQNSRSYTASEDRSSTSRSSASRSSSSRSSASRSSASRSSSSRSSSSQRTYANTRNYVRGNSSASTSSGSTSRYGRSSRSSTSASNSTGRNKKGRRG
ncbi:MAG: lytic transglycosylase domain-containing protein [Prevotella sp.]|nr:lytic transglycosylase domain-containing protein [Prevotella sp.]